MKLFAKSVFFQSTILIFFFFVIYSLCGLYMHGFSFNYLVDRESHIEKNTRSVEEKKPQTLPSTTWKSQ